MKQFAFIKINPAALGENSWETGERKCGGESQRGGNMMILKTHLCHGVDDGDIC